MMTASLRAGATAAFFIPARLAIRIAQAIQGGATFERLAQDDVTGLAEHRTHRPVPIL
jgi:hypothetical protein